MDKAHVKKTSPKAEVLGIKFIAPKQMKYLLSVEKKWGLEARFVCRVLLLYVNF